MEYVRFCGEIFLIMLILLFILEFAGRKSVEQFSLIQVVVIVSIGEIALISTYEENFNILKMVLASCTMMFFLITFEWLELKFNWIENLISKKALIIIDNGKINYNILKKERLTVDQIEMKMRLKGITDLYEIKTATLETNGDIGYEYKDEYKPLTEYHLMNILNQQQNKNDDKKKNIFEEIRTKHLQKHNKKYK